MVQWSGVTYKVKYKWRKFKQQLVRWQFLARDLLVFYLPSQRIRDLPKSQALPLGLAALVLVAAFAGYVFFATFLRNLNTTYLSLDQDSDSICEDVLRNINNDYFFDTKGYWLGNRGYNYSHGLYLFKAQIKRSLPEYQYSVRGLLNYTLAPIGNFMASHNLGINLLVLMTFQAKFQDEGNDQDTDTFLFNSAPPNIFNNGVYSSAIGTIDSLCELKPSVAFDRANALFHIEYNYGQFHNSSACMNAIDPKHFGYDPEWSGDMFKIAIDVNTLATTIATNMDIIPTNSFEVIDPSPYKETSEGVQYFFTQFESMQSFVCFSNDHNATHSTQYACFMRLGDIFVLPFFNHGGYNATYPSYCDCEDKEQRHSEMCNKFHFLSGFLFYDFNSTETPSDSLERLLSLVFDSNLSSDRINRYAFDISYDLNNPFSTTRGDQDWKNDHFDFCRSPDGKFCSILTFYKSSDTNSVSDFHFPVYNGSCNDFVTLDDEASEKLINNPPTQLVEPYVRCKLTVFSALSDTVGIVSGNVTAMSPLLMLAIFYIYYYCFIKCKGVKKEVTYSNQELDAIAKFLTFNLALARDGLHPTQLRAEAASASGTSSGQRDGQAILEDSVLLRLLNELKQEEVCERFHAPLKEDDDSEEEHEGGGEMSNKGILASSSNPIRTEDSIYAKNSFSSFSSSFSSTGSGGGIEMRDVEGQGEDDAAVTAMKKRRRKRKKKQPVRTDPNILLNPLVYRLEY